MIIYNEKKEFIGIEEEDLREFGFNNLAELLQQVEDFADLFVKTPGHIHNFKHVHWIDFIASADSIDQNKVILRIKGKNYRGNIGLKNFYLVESPYKNGYLVEIKNLRELTAEEFSNIQDDISNMPAPKPRTVPQPQEQEATRPQPTTSSIEQTFSPSIKEVPTPPQQEEKPLDLNLDDVMQESSPQEDHKESQQIQDEPIDLLLEDEVPSVKKQEEGDSFLYDEDDPFKDYHYDPKVASEELGLPTDLVEEFIQDFITQANEFKPELYEAFETGKIDILRMQSHKLKGVAANLRIEDAYDALVTINTSDDMQAVKTNLDKFYNIILKKLSGEPITSIPSPSSSHEEEIQLEAPQEVISSQEEKIVLEIDENDNLQKDQDDEEKIDLVLDDPLEIQDNISLKLDETQEEPIIEIDIPKEEQHTKISLDINKEKLAATMGIDPQTYSELLVDFKDDAKNIIDTLQTSLQENNQSQMQKLIIRFKGMSENMHLQELVELSEKFLNASVSEQEVILKTISEKIDSINEME